MDDINISEKQGNRIKRKGSWFCGTTHSLRNIDAIKKNINEFPFYAYIIHDKDEGKSLHIHFVLNCSGSRSIKSIGDVLDCDYQDIQIAKRPRSCIRYLVHIDNPDKFRYEKDNIVSNNIDRVNYYFDNINHSIKFLYSDLKKVKTGEISPDDFCDKYSSEFATLPFYQKIKTLEVIDKMSYK